MSPKNIINIKSRTQENTNILNVILDEGGWVLLGFMDLEMKAYIREATREENGEMCARSLDAIKNGKYDCQKALMHRKGAFGLVNKGTWAQKQHDEMMFRKKYLSTKLEREIN